MAEEFKPTPEQQEVIDSLDKNLLVSAAAGSGKTFVLIECIKHLITKKQVPISRMLVVTFTKAAANEMKHKLSNALEKLDNKDDFIRQQLEDVAQANISTIHSFCARLLKTYFYEIGLDPSFVLIDEIESDVLKAKSYEKLIEQAFAEHDNDFFELLDIFSKNRKDENFKNTLIKINNFLDTQIDSEKFISSTIESAYNANYDKNSAINYVIEKAVEEAGELEKEFERLSSMCKSNETEKLSTILVSIKYYLDKIASSKCFEEFFAAFSAEPEVESIGRIKLPPEMEFLKEEVNDFRDSFIKYCKSYKKCFAANSLSELSTKMSVTKKRIQTLYAWASKFNQVYTSLKKEKVALDFSDLEHLSIKMLQNNNVRKNIQDNFDHVFVDEYQDINYVQEEILRLVSKPASRVMVGDVKQSIYKFRESEPQIFIDKFDSYSKLIDKQGTAKVLRSNYRSHQQVLWFSNAIFEKVMTRDFGGVDYKQTSMFEKGDQPYPEDGKGEFPTVKVNIVDKESEKETNDTFLQSYSVKNHDFNIESEAKTGMVEGRLVVKEIRELLGKTVYVAKKGYAKRLTYSDFAILTASRGEYLKHLLNELDQSDIPYSSDVNGDVFDDEATNAIKCLLQIIDNPNQDVPLLGALSSAFFDFTPSELAEVKIAERGEKYFFEAFQAALDNKSVGIDLQTKIDNFYKKINYYRQLSKYNEVDNLIIKIMKDSNFETTILASSTGEISLQKIHNLLSYINGKSYNASLSEFLNAINETKIKFDLTSDSCSVKVTTIHKSKGLEFPVVILVGAGRGLFVPEKKDFSMTNNFGATMKYVDTKKRTYSSNIIINAAQIASRFSSSQEKVRLLYVALTRAVNHLIVIGSKQVNSKRIKKPSEAKCFLDWIEYGIESKSEGLLPAETKFSVEHFAYADLAKTKVCKKTRNYVPAEIDEEFVKKFEDVLSFKYGYSQFVHAPAKTSVSEILSNISEEENIKRVFDYESAGAAKGIAYHKLMQYIDLNTKTEKELDVQLSAMKKDGELTEEEYSLINKTEIIKCVTSTEFINLVKGKNVKREQEFIALSGTDSNIDKSDSTIVQGIVDLIVFNEDGSATIVDYKTNNWANEFDYINKYKLQLDLYARAIADAFNVKIKGKYIYSFRLAKLIEL